MEINDVKILIEDVVVPTKGVGKYFSIKATDHVILGKPPMFYWQLYAQLVKPGEESDEQPVKYPGPLLLDGNLTMTEQEYSQWGTDDTYVIDWALGKLGFIEIK